MANIDLIVVTYGVATAEYAVLAVLLIVAAVKNHFAHRQFRPAILSLAALSTVLAAQNGMRICSAWMRTSGQIPDYIEFLESPWWLMTNVLATIVGAILVFTLILAYPAARNSLNRRSSDRTMADEAEAAVVITDRADMAAAELKLTAVDVATELVETAKAREEAE